MIRGYDYYAERALDDGMVQIDTCLWMYTGAELARLKDDPELAEIKFWFSWGKEGRINDLYEVKKEDFDTDVKTFIELDRMEDDYVPMDDEPIFGGCDD